MKSLERNILFFVLPVFLILKLPAIGADLVSSAPDDSVRVEELILIDTLDLRIPGPSNDLAFYLNGMVFLSNTKFHQKMLPEHIPFGQAQTYFVPLEYIALESSRPLFENDPFPYSPGGMSFSRDYTKVYFTKSVESGRRTVEKIFETSIVNSEVSPYRMMPFCDNPARYMHPAVSVDGSYMVFASDLTPSSGGLDLFMVKKESTGWGPPVNLGRTINTSGHEWFPFLDKHHNLYFSSTGHMGYGGYDIFVCLFDGSGWGEPLNLTGTINSINDELAFSIHPNGREMVYSISVQSDQALDQAYRISLNTGAMLVTGVDEPKSRDIALLVEDLVRTGYTKADFAGMALEEVPDRTPTLVITEPLLEPAEAETGTEPSEEPEEAAVPPVAPPVAVVAEPEIEPGTEEEPKTAEEPEPTIETEPELQAVEEPEPETAEEPELRPAEEPELRPADEPELQVAQESEDAVAVPGTIPGPEPVKEEAAVTKPDPDQVIFRVQFLSSSRANTMPSITIEGRQYKTFEYYYKGAYRITVGEFTTVQEALELRAKCKNAGYNQAFVAAFRGNERELDPAVFRR